MKILKKCLLIILIIFLFFNSTVFGVTNVDLSGYNFIDITTLENDVVEKAKNTDEYLSGNYYLLFGKNDNSLYTVYFIKKVEGLKCYISSFDNNKFIIKANIDTDCVYYRYDVSSGLYSRNIQNSVNFWVYSTDKENCIFYSEIDIFEDLDNSILFFQPPVVVVIPVLEGVEELPKAVTTTLKMILPVGLVVFGILLLVYIIRLLILRVT